LETAEPIARALEQELVVRQGLVETDIGEWAGKTLKSVRRLKAWRNVQNAPSLFRFPGGESFAETQHRMCQEIETICSEHDGKDLVACVSHADPIKLATAYYIGLPLDNFQRLMVSPASITALYIGESASHLINLNFDLSFNLPKG
jgi:probable phosphoglycerate mutase